MKQVVLERDSKRRALYNFMNELLFKFFDSERKVLKNHDLPYGLSLIAVVKPATTTFAVHI